MLTTAPSPAVSTAVTSDCCSASLELLASCSAAPSASFSFTQEVADALYAAAAAKAALQAAQDTLSQATTALDLLVEAGVLPEKNLPTFYGFLIYRTEGRLSWTYPQAIKELEANLKKRKQLAEQLGEATQKRGNPFWTIKATDPGATDPRATDPGATDPRATDQRFQ